MEQIKDFQYIYPFTTESISGYITEMDIQDKSVLTLGSSCDQAFNSLLVGAKEVTVFDINERIKEFYELKRKLILETSRQRLFEKVSGINHIPFFDNLFTAKQLEKMNLYLQNDENYNKLRKILEEKTIKFITGDVFNIDEYLTHDNKYDRVILSNVLQYLKMSNLPIEKEVYRIYSGIEQHLNKDAIVQLYYLYGSIYPNSFYKIINEFNQNGIIFQNFSCDEQDSVILTKKIM